MVTHTHAFASDDVGQESEQQLSEQVPNGRRHLDSEILVAGQLAGQARSCEYLSTGLSQTKTSAFRVRHVPAVWP